MRTCSIILLITRNLKYIKIRINTHYPLIILMSSTIIKLKKEPEIYPILFYIQLNLSIRNKDHRNQYKMIAMLTLSTSNQRQYKMMANKSKVIHKINSIKTRMIYHLNRVTIKKKVTNSQQSMLTK